MKPLWDGPRLVVQPGSRKIFRPDHATAGGHDVVELWRWSCATCSRRRKNVQVGGNGESLDEALDWFVAHLESAHPEVRWYGVRLTA